jgi:hypothetical protein
MKKKKEIKKKKRKKEGRNRGGSLPKKWGGRTTPFLAKGWPATPYRPYGGGRSHPRPLRVVRPPRKAKKKKSKKMGLGFWGWPNHPQGPGGGFGHPLRPVGGVGSHPQALGGGPATPFFGQGVASATPISPFFLHFFFFFLFLFFLISFFFHKKKNPKICKTTPFFPKRRSFGVEGIMDNLPPKGS